MHPQRRCELQAASRESTLARPFLFRSETRAFWTNWRSQRPVKRMTRPSAALGAYTGCLRECALRQRSVRFILPLSACLAALPITAQNTQPVDSVPAPSFRTGAQAVVVDVVAADGSAAAAQPLPPHVFANQPIAPQGSAIKAPGVYSSISSSSGSDEFAGGFGGAADASAFSFGAVAGSVGSGGCSNV